jgi:hypothetical protein
MSNYDNNHIQQNHVECAAVELRCVKAAAQEAMTRSSQEAAVGAAERAVRAGATHSEKVQMTK